MRALTLILPLSLALLLGDAQAQQRSTVYQWKDAKGVTQYSETPPAKGQAAVRRITARDGVSQQIDETTPPAASPNCLTARKNLEILSSDKPVTRAAEEGMDAPAVLTDEQRAAERSLAEAAIKAYCTDAG